jgi:hypothetical protein
MHSVTPHLVCDGAVAAGARVVMLDEISQAVKNTCPPETWP